MCWAFCILLSGWLIAWFSENVVYPEKGECCSGSGDDGRKFHNRFEFVGVMCCWVKPTVVPICGTPIDRRKAMWEYLSNRAMSYQTRPHMNRR